MYVVILTGRNPHIPEEVVYDNLATLFSVDREVVLKMFAQGRYLLKSGLRMEEANRYSQSVGMAGGLVEIEPERPAARPAATLPVNLPADAKAEEAPAVTEWEAVWPYYRQVIQKAQSNDPTSPEFEGAGSSSPGYYMTAFKGFYEGGGSSKFNWAAFFFTGVWFFYRKMRIQACVFFAALLLPQIVIAVIQHKSSTVWPALVLQILAGLVVGMIGNRLYYKHATKQVNLSLGKPPDERAAFLQKGGGVSLWQALVFPAMCQLALIAVLGMVAVAVESAMKQPAQAYTQLPYQPASPPVAVATLPAPPMPALERWTKTDKNRFLERCDEEGMKKQDVSQSQRDNFCGCLLRVVAGYGLPSQLNKLTDEDNNRMTSQIQKECLWALRR